MKVLGFGRGTIRSHFLEKSLWKRKRNSPSGKVVLEKEPLDLTPGEVALEEEPLDLTLWRSRFGKGNIRSNSWRSRFGRGNIRSHPLEKSLWKRKH